MLETAEAELILFNGRITTMDRRGPLVETFLVGSWVEHLRQHHRGTIADQALLTRLGELTGDGGVVHLVDARAVARAGLDLSHAAHTHGSHEQSPTANP